MARLRRLHQRRVPPVQDQGHRRRLLSGLEALRKAICYDYVAGNESEDSRDDFVDYHSGNNFEDIHQAETRNDTKAKTKTETEGNQDYHNGNGFGDFEADEEGEDIGDFKDFQGI